MHISLSTGFLAFKFVKRQESVTYKDKNDYNQDSVKKEID